MEIILRFIMLQHIYSVTGTKLAGKFTLNLDLPPHLRWKEIVIAHKNIILNTIKDIKLHFEGICNISINEKVYVPFTYRQEMIGIADVLGVPYHDVLIANFFYEIITFIDNGMFQKQCYKILQLLTCGLFSRHSVKEYYNVGCTSVIVEKRNGIIMHGFNMDFPIPMENSIITINFERAGKVLYTGTSFVGHVGLCTGQKPYRYTLSLHARREEDLYHNYYPDLDGGDALAAFYIRDLLEAENLGYQEVVENIFGRTFVTPCYIIVGGNSTQEGVVITLTLKGVVDIEMLSNDKWYLVQTNTDRYSGSRGYGNDLRWEAADSILNITDRTQATLYDLKCILSVIPVLVKHMTAFTVTMSAVRPYLYAAWVHHHPRQNRNKPHLVSSNFVDDDLGIHN